MAPAEPHAQRDLGEARRRQQDDLGDDAAEQAGCDCPHPDHELGALVEAAHRHDAEHPPHLVGQEARRNEHQIGGEIGERLHRRASRRRCTP